MGETLLLVGEVLSNKTMNTRANVNANHHQNGQQTMAPNTPNSAGSAQQSQQQQVKQQKFLRLEW